LKVHFGKYKYLWIGGIMGIAQQLLGRLDYYLYKGHDIFSFSAVMGGLSLYAFIILFVIKREVPEKQNFKDLFLFFLGLDFFYYLYVFAGELVLYLTIDTRSHETLYYFQHSTGEIVDFIKWTSIGTAAGIWAYFAAKARNRNQKVLHYLMIAPLFAVIALELVSFLIGMYHYIIQEYNRVHGIMNTPGISYGCPISEVPTTLILLAMSVHLYFFKKTPSRKKADRTEPNSDECH